MTMYSLLEIFSDYVQLVGDLEFPWYPILMTHSLRVLPEGIGHAAHMYAPLGSEQTSVPPFLSSVAGVSEQDTTARLEQSLNTQAVIPTYVHTCTQT